ncbi:FMN-binding protein [Alteromonadaceae bacterium BrNp21-10]|nr:FMN-binding protein [Alteromonadaceae bacterium BrNp21-10]
MSVDFRNSLLWFPVAALSVPAYAVDYFTIAEAQKMLFPSAQQFLVNDIEFSDDDKDKIKDLAGVRQRHDKQPVWKAQANGEQIGWFIVDDVVGKHEYITYGLAIDMQGKVIGLEIMSYRETHGSEVRRQNWRDQFVGKQVNEEFALDEDIQNISGATLSCRNLTDGVKRLLVIHQMALAKL